MVITKPSSRNRCDQKGLIESDPILHSEQPILGRVVVGVDERRSVSRDFEAQFEGDHQC